MRQPRMGQRDRRAAPVIIRKEIRMSSVTKKAAKENPSGGSRPRWLDDRAAEARGPEATGKHPAIDEQIRLRAYELYIERGAQPNADLGDWLRAERELRERANAEEPDAAS